MGRDMRLGCLCDAPTCSSLLELTLLALQLPILANLGEIKASF